MAADAAARNAALAECYQEIDGLLAEALRTNSRVDLDGLRPHPQYPPFPRPDLEHPLSPPPPPFPEPEPVFVETPPPSGLSSVFGGKKKQHAEAEQRARAAFGMAYESWRSRMAELPARQAHQAQQYQMAETRRQAELTQARAAHQAECERITDEVDDANKTIDRLKADLNRGLEYAVHEYIGIVLAKSVYPDAFPIDHDFEYDSDSREVTITVLVPPPDALPMEREFKYTKARDEITSSLLPKTEQKQRYANAVHQVALRTLHEIFSGDHHGWVQTVALTVACDAMDPARGFVERKTFVTMPADRSMFAAINLANVVPLATLQHLGASASKNPFELASVSQTRGVRRL